MAGVLGVFSLLSLGSGVLLLLVARSSIHEIQACLALLGFAVFFGAGCMVTAVERLRQTLRNVHGVAEGDYRDP